MNKYFEAIRFLSRYVVVSFLLTLLLLTIYFFQIGKPDNFYAFFYVGTIPLYYYFPLLILLILFVPILFFQKIQYLIIIPKVLLDTFLIADLLVFKVYRFHIDMMFVNMLLHDFNGIGISTSMIVGAIVIFFLIVSFNIWIFRKLRDNRKFQTKKLNLALLIFFLLGQVVHIWAYEYNQQFITKYTPYFPYYSPITSSSMMKKIKRNFPRIIPAPYEKPNENMSNLLGKNKLSSGMFTYPLKELVLTDTISNKPNVLFFLTESWRFDMLSAKITPNISKLSESSYQFVNHYSGGSVTVSGLFSLMYGLHPSYLKFAQSNPYQYQTIFTKSLKDMGYSIRAYTSSNLDRFALKPMFFGEIKSEDYSNQRSLLTIENDRFVVSKLIEDIQQDTTREPWFKFVFLNASHHNYKYPEEHELFSPVPKNSEGFVFNKDIDSEPFLNDYKNSLHFIDKLFGDIYDALEELGLDKNTIIVITSDHGEEFNDNGEGYWGHGSNFTRYQTSVPLIIKLPQNSEAIRVAKLSGHVDIVPSILNQILKSGQKISDYSSGHDLFNLPEKRGIIMASYMDKAYLIDDKIYSNGLSFKSYYVDDINNENKAFSYDLINQLRQEETVFLKSN